MAGTVERYGKGFRYRVQLGADPGTGKRRWATKGGFATEKDATKAMPRVIVAADDGLVVKRSTLRLGQYLTEWLERVTPDLKATTAAGYGRAVTKLDDKLGQVRVQDLTPLQIEQVYVGLVKDGLAPKTVRNLHSVLRRALADAERLGLVIRNAAAAARPPSVPHHEQRTWSATELNTFLATVSDHRLLASFVVFATTGMRRGEVLGLRWSDVDLANGRLSVVNTITTVNGRPVETSTKTKKSRRRVSLDAATLGALRAHQERQDIERASAGSAWSDTGLVFTREDGSAIHPDRFSHWFADLVEKAGVPPIRLHDLRHTHATLALEAGVHPKVVSERLGHATVGITLDLYSHVTPSLDELAAETIAALVDVPGQSRSSAGTNVA